jgi:hypothetical protein
MSKRSIGKKSIGHLGISRKYVMVERIGIQCSELESFHVACRQNDGWVWRNGRRSEKNKCGARLHKN